MKLRKNIDSEARDGTGMEQSIHDQRTEMDRAGNRLHHEIPKNQTLQHESQIYHDQENEDEGKGDVGEEGAAEE